MKNINNLKIFHAVFGRMNKKKFNIKHLGLVPYEFIIFLIIVNLCEVVFDKETILFMCK